MEIGQGGLDDVFFDEGAGGVEAAVEVEGGDDGFEGVGEQGGLSAASALLFAAAEAQERAEVDAGGDFAEMAAADEGGAEAGEFALARGREAAEEGFGDGEAEDSVADELKLLVVGGGVGERLGVGLVGEGAMGEGPGEELGPLEAMIEERTQGRRSPSDCAAFLWRVVIEPLCVLLYRTERTSSEVTSVSVGVADDMRLSRLCRWGPGGRRRRP